MTHKVTIGNYFLILFLILKNQFSLQSFYFHFQQNGKLLGKMSDRERSL